MKKILILLLLLIYHPLWSQPCGVTQLLTASQQTQLQQALATLETALQADNWAVVDSISVAIKGIYATQGGIPDQVEANDPITTNTTWLSLTEALSLSRLLVQKDSADYAQLDQIALGKSPLLGYQPHSIYLRAAAEMATGFLQLADRETDAARKSAYTSWALAAFDSLATMQLANGAFPFPDLRPYGDPLFGPIIQNFLNACGADSVNVLQNGWIIDDKNTGEFKFDAGVIADAYFKAYVYTGNAAYKAILIRIADYLITLKISSNYNYNSFVALGLSRAYQLTNNALYLNRAIENLRYGVLTGQNPDGRWVDGHNARSVYHHIMLKNSSPVLEAMPVSDPRHDTLRLMIELGARNSLSYFERCGVTSGYEWLFATYLLSSGALATTLHDSISDLIGRYIQQSAINGKFLDVATIGAYVELLNPKLELDEAHDPQLLVYPNPTHGWLQVRMEQETEEKIRLLDLTGQEVPWVLQNQLGSDLTLDVSGLKAGTYLLCVGTSRLRIVIQ